MTGAIGFSRTLLERADTNTGGLGGNPPMKRQVVIRFIDMQNIKPLVDE